MKYQSNQRLLIVGMTGWGKSHYAKKAIYPKLSRVFFHDPKRQHNDLRGTLVHNIDELNRAWGAKLTKIVYQPTLIDVEDFNTVCHMIYDRGNTVLIVDEAAFYTGANNIPYWYETLIKMGRSRNCGVVSLSQQPTYIKGVLISESDWLVAFRLELKSDREKIAGKVGNEAYKTGELPKFHYLEYHAGEGCAWCKPI